MDGAQRLLKPQTGISIPYQYTSYLAPISSSKIWNKIRSYNDPKYYETAFVVKLHNFYQLFDEKEVFTFHHPNPSVAKAIALNGNSLTQGQGHGQQHQPQQRQQQWGGQTGMSSGHNKRYKSIEFVDVPVDAI